MNKQNISVPFLVSTNKLFKLGKLYLLFFYNRKNACCLLWTFLKRRRVKLEAQVEKKIVFVAMHTTTKKQLVQSLNYRFATPALLEALKTKTFLLSTTSKISVMRNLFHWRIPSKEWAKAQFWNSNTKYLFWVRYFFERFYVFFFSDTWQAILGEVKNKSLNVKADCIVFFAAIFAIVNFKQWKLLLTFQYSCIRLKVQKTYFNFSFRYGDDDDDETFTHSHSHVFVHKKSFQPTFFHSTEKGLYRSKCDVHLKN